MGCGPATACELISFVNAPSLSLSYVFVSCTAYFESVKVVHGHVVFLAIGIEENCQAEQSAGAVGSTKFGRLVFVLCLVGIGIGICRSLSPSSAASPRRNIRCGRFFF